MKRYLTIGISVLALALFAVGCAGTAAKDSNTAPASTANSATGGTTATDTASADAAASGTLELTLDQLKQYDGKNGNPAYVVVDGIIYDVTNVGAWKNGEHNGYSAGNDLTDIIKNKSPHGVKNLEGVPIVGKIVAG